MDVAKKIITRLPLEELWNANGMLNANRVSYINRTDVMGMMKSGATFVVADVGQPPRWIDAADRFEFWKAEVKPRLVDADDYAFLERCPGESCYFASKWDLSDGPPLIVLEKHH
jgi:hypothetical protein